MLHFNVCCKSPASLVLLKWSEISEKIAECDVGPTATAVRNLPATAPLTVTSTVGGIWPRDFHPFRPIKKREGGKRFVLCAL